MVRITNEVFITSAVRKNLDSVRKSHRYRNVDVLGGSGCLCFHSQPPLLTEFRLLTVILRFSFRPTVEKDRTKPRIVVSFIYVTMLRLLPHHRLDIASISASRLIIRLPRAGRTCRTSMAMLPDPSAMVAIAPNVTIFRSGAPDRKST